MYIDIADVIEDVAEDAVEIELNGWTLTTSMPVKQLQVYSTMGQMMESAENTDEMDVSGLPTGVYVVKALTGKQTAVKKIYIR